MVNRPRKHEALQCTYILLYQHHKKLKADLTSRGFPPCVPHCPLLSPLLASAPSLPRTECLLPASTSLNQHQAVECLQGGRQTTEYKDGVKFVRMNCRRSTTRQDGWRLAITRTCTNAQCTMITPSITPSSAVCACCCRSLLALEQRRAKCRPSTSGLLSSLSGERSSALSHRVLQPLI